MILTLAILANLLPLAWYKYSAFLAESLQGVLAQVGWSWAGSPLAKMPLGISFFTFHAISYLVDIYRGQTSVQRNPFRLALYISLFPQLVAGPIVRYADVAEQLLRRTVSLENFAEGVERFVVGLAKKLVVANSLAVVADAVFEIPDGDCRAAWPGWGPSATCCRSTSISLAIATWPSAWA